MKTSRPVLLALIFASIVLGATMLPLLTHAQTGTVEFLIPTADLTGGVIGPLAAEDVVFVTARSLGTVVVGSTAVGGSGACTTIAGQVAEVQSAAVANPAVPTPARSVSLIVTSPSPLHPGTRIRAATAIGACAVNATPLTKFRGTVD